MDEALLEVARQMLISNRITVARELFKLQYIEPEDYIDELRDIDEDLH